MQIRWPYAIVTLVLLTTWALKGQWFICGALIATLVVAQIVLYIRKRRRSGGS